MENNACGSPAAPSCVAAAVTARRSSSSMARCVRMPEARAACVPREARLAAGSSLRRRAQAWASARRREGEQAGDSIALAMEAMRAWKEACTKCLRGRESNGMKQPCKVRWRQEWGRYTHPVGA